MHIFYDGAQNKFFNTTQYCKGGYHYMLLATLAIAVIRADKSF